MRQARTPKVTDTTRDAQKVFVELLRATPPWRKLQMVDDLNRSLRQLVTSELARKHPELSDKELRLLFVQRLYGTRVAEIVSKVLIG